MNRAWRIALEFFGPPPLAATILLAFESVADGHGFAVGWKGFLMALAFSYLFAALPSAIFTMVLELSYAKGLNVASWRTPLLASFLGLLSGTAIALAWSKGPDNSHDMFFVLPPLGWVTGAIIGALVRSLSRKPLDESPRPTS